MFTILMQSTSLVFFSLTVLYAIYVRLKFTWINSVSDLFEKWMKEGNYELVLKNSYTKMCKPTFKNWFYFKRFNEDLYK